MVPLVSNDSSAILGAVVGAVAIYQILYLLVGKETIEISQNEITMWNGIGLCAPSTVRAESVQDLRCDSTTYQRRTAPFGSPMKFASHCIGVTRAALAAYERHPN